MSSQMLAPRQNPARRKPADRGASEREVKLGWPALFIGALAVALVGGATALALALAIGALHTTAGRVLQQTTVVEPPRVHVVSVKSQNWASVYARTAPGTVDITVHATTTVNTPFGTEQEQSTDLGSGFVLDGRGDILTAAHVVAGAKSISVTFPSGATRTAKLLGVDDSADLAVVNIDPAGITLYPLALGSSQSLAVGDPVGVIGDPLGFDRSLSTGVVSGLDRTIEAPNGFTIAHSIQTDAALNPGNSGGPILDAAGQVIGIADQIATGTNQFGRSTSETSTGVGFAVPIDLAKAELAQLERGQRVAHAYLGVSTGETAGGQPGALIAEVQPGTPAARAGLKQGDLIIAFNGAPIASSSALIDALAAAHVGEHVSLRIVRGSSTLTLDVTLAREPEQASSS